MRRTEEEKRHYVRSVRQQDTPRYVRAVRASPGRAGGALGAALTVLVLAAFLGLGLHLYRAGVPYVTGYVVLPSGQRPPGSVIMAWAFGNVTIYQVRVPAWEARIDSVWVPVSPFVELAPWSGGSTANPYQTWYASDQYLTVMRYNPAWNGSGVTVAVVDTGIDYLNPVFQPGKTLIMVVSVKYSNTTANTPFIWWNFQKDPNVTAAYELDRELFIKYGRYAWLDTNGHGTAVSSIIVAQPGVDPPVQGLAPGARLIMISAFFSNGSAPLNWVLTALQWVYNYSAQYNIRVLSLSWGAILPPGNPIQVAVQQVESRGVIVVAAAGNYGNVPGDIGYPAAAPGVIAVGALDCYTGQVAWFSSMGPTYDTQVKPQFVSCGVNVPVVWPSYLSSPGPLDPYDSNVTALSGTSFSAPAVAAIIADWLEYYHYYHGVYPSASQVLSILAENSEHLTFPNDIVGYGIPLAPP